MTKDLRSFLADYTRTHPEQVLCIDREVSHDQEIVAIIFALEKRQQYPILIFNRVRAASGGISPHPVIINMFASRARCAEAFGSTYERAGQDYFNKTMQAPIRPVVVDRREAPVKDVVLSPGQFNLLDYPAPVHHFMEPGPYFSGGYFTSYDLETHTDNSSLHRGWITGPDRVRINLNPNNHSGLSLAAYRRAGKKMPWAFWQGHHILACIGAETKMAYPKSHYDMMGVFLGEALRLVPSETLGDDFLIPADAEFVVEGWVDPTTVFAEGPFGEYAGYLGGQVVAPEFEVTCVTHRRDAYWHAILNGHADGATVGGLGIEGGLYNRLKQSIPSLQAVYFPMSAAQREHVYIQLKNPNPGEAREAIMAALPFDWRLKHAFVVDDDIDIFDEREVLWAIATRTQWDKDLMVFTDMRRNPLDPSQVNGHATKAGIDATVPRDRPYPPRNSVTVQVQLEDYVAADRLNAVPLERL